MKSGRAEKLTIFEYVVRLNRGNPYPPFEITDRKGGNLLHLNL
jgi:hypothetical protein